MALEIPKKDVYVENPETGQFKVQSQSDKKLVYKLSFGNERAFPKCECYGFMKTGLPCKHFFAIFQHIPSWSFYKLPKNYINSQFFQIDKAVMDNIEGKQSNVSLNNKNEKNPETSTFSIPQTSEVPTNIPKAKKYSNTTASSCREILGQVRSLTFLTDDETTLKEVSEKLAECKRILENATKSENGLFLEQKLQEKPIKRKPLTLRKNNYKRLPLPPKKNPFAGRVGKKANEMKRSINVKVDIPQEIKAKKPKNAITIETDVVDLEAPYHSHLETADRNVSHNHKDNVLITGVSTSDQTPDGNVHNHEEDNVLITGVSTSDQTADGNVHNHEEEDVLITGVSTSDQTRPKRRLIKVDSQDIAAIHSGEELTDSIISIAQNILKKQNPNIGGLEDTALGQTYSFSIQGGEFIQILHTGQHHWVMISNIGCHKAHVNYYDSLFGGDISPHVEKQVSAIMHEDGPTITVHAKSVQQQHNMVDCGIYAIAFSTSLVYGEDPSNTNYERSLLRKHLIDCLTKDRMEPFPPMKTTKFEYQLRPKEKVIELKLYCSCRMPWNQMEARYMDFWFAQCYSCKEWFHRKCVSSIPKEVFLGKLIWECDSCSLQQHVIIK